MIRFRTGCDQCSIPVGDQQPDHLVAIADFRLSGRKRDNSIQRAGSVVVSFRSFLRTVLNQPLRVGPLARIRQIGSFDHRLSPVNGADASNRTLHFALHEHGQAIGSLFGNRLENFADHVAKRTHTDM